MEDFGKVSIITPNHNGEKTIREAIKSVLKQSYQNWEMVIVDDCSTDDSVSVISSFSDPRIRLIQNVSNCGPGASRNAAIKAAAGRFLAFLDSDDVWFPEKLSKQLEFMVSHDCAFSCHGYCVCDEALNVLREYIPPERVTYDELLTNNTIGCLSAMIDTAKVEKVLMPEGKYTREDMVTWLMVLKQCGECLSVGRILAKYRTGTTSVSSNKARLLKYQYKMYRDDLKLGWLRSAWLTALSICNKVLHKY